MKRRTLGLRFAARGFGLGATLWTAASCQNIDTTRQAPPEATLGDDLYGLMCDRVGASALPEDLTGASFTAVCHPTATGTPVQYVYVNTVDQAQLPPVTPLADCASLGDAASQKSCTAMATSRALSIAKVEAMASHRSELIQAFNSTFPDIQIADTQNPGAKIRLHDALSDFAQRLTPLYGTNPYDATGEPLLPAQTRALGRLFDAMATSSNGLAAFSRIWGRQGYRPFPIGLGAIRAALAYPQLRTLSNTSLDILGPGGVAVPELQQLLTIAQNELATSTAIVEPLPDYQCTGGATPLCPTQALAAGDGMTAAANALVDAKAQPNRARSTVEVLAATLLSHDPSFALASDSPQYIALRDRRGFVVPVGNLPGVPGTVKAPFMDANDDGFADVDAFGQFLTTAGTPMSGLPPFAIPGLPMASATDSFGRPVTPTYQYADTSQRLTAALLRTLVPLVDPTESAPAGDANAYLVENEALMYAMAGAYKLYGRRADAQWDYAADMMQPMGASCPTCVPYESFLGSESPFPDLIHAAGQVLADPDSDAILLSTISLLENPATEPAMARLIGAALNVRAIAAAHDTAAAAGKEPAAALPYQTTVWETMAQIVACATARPGLVTQLIGALADPTIVTPVTTTTGTTQNMGQTLAALMANKDQLTYDPTNINGDAINLTTGTNADPQTPVDRTQMLTPPNTSGFQRSLQLIHDTNGIKACNKSGATVPSLLAGITVTYPLFGGTLDECDLFEFDNLAAFYLDSILDPNHPKRSQLVIKDATLNDLISFLGDFGVSPDSLFETSSGITDSTAMLGGAPAWTGLNLHPSSQALNRLVFFGADSDLYPSMPDLDALNDDPNSPLPTDNFIHSTIEPVSGIPCPLDGTGVPVCPTYADTLRIRDRNTIFLLERFGFYNYLQPIVTVLANQSCTADGASCDTTSNVGEQILIDVIDLLNQHWPSKDHGPECSPAPGPNPPACNAFAVAPAALNEKYCSEAGVDNYEPILVDTFNSDLIAALNDFAVAASQVSMINVERGGGAGSQQTLTGTVSGAQVLEKVTQILFDPTYAAKVGMADRQGNTTVLSVDGVTQLPVTGYNLFADALHKIDTTFDSVACSCTGLSGSAAAACQANAAGCQADADVRHGEWERARSLMVDAFLAVDGTTHQFTNPATPKMLTTLLRVVREQLNANCPDRETSGKCDWARTTLDTKLANTLSGPLFAAMMDLQEAVRTDEPSRRQLEQLLTYILQSPSNDALADTLASFSDLTQLLADDDNFAPIFNAVSNAASPDGTTPGAADTLTKVLKAMAGDDYDRYHVLDTVLPALVTPVGGAGLTPIEVFMNTVADVNRIDASQTTPLASADYEAILGTVRDFMTSNTRGLEQFYYIVNNRPQE